jgi:hypothetical protein
MRRSTQRIKKSESKSTVNAVLKSTAWNRNCNPHVTITPRNANDAPDKLRKQEYRRLLEERCKVLSRSKYQGLIGPDNQTESQIARFESIRTLNLKKG